MLNITDLRQLYLYSKPVSEIYGRFPDQLAFNCFRSGQWIYEPFDQKAYASALAWASDTVTKIFKEEKFAPTGEFFKCRYLCDCASVCEFKQ